MLFEITSSIIAAGVVGYTYIAQSGATSDAAKIQRICSNCGLHVKENGRIKNIHLQRKSKKEWGTEYVYRIPLGLSFHDFEKKTNHIQDGLNNKKSVLDLSLSDFKQLKLQKDILDQIRSLFEKKKTQRKEIEMSYDGMLRIRVYDEALTDFLPYENFNLKGWQIPIGVSRSDFVTHDFEKIPHMVVAGATRYGKSVFLKNVITTLIDRKSKEVRFTLIDLKGGLTFARYRDCSQVEEVASNVDESMEALRSIQKRMKERMVEFQKEGKEDIREAGYKKRHFIIIDEAAQIASAGETDKEIKKKKVECESIIAEIARIGGALGFRLIFATQYPTADTLPRQVKQNCDAKLCFRLQSEIASTVVLDEGGAADLPLIKGRAIYMTDRKQIVQTPFIENDYIQKVIEPHVIFKARKEEQHEQNNSEAEKGRGNTLVIEETGLS